MRHGDPVSVHTLTAAAHGVLEGINKNLGFKPIAFDINLIREDKRKMVQDKLNETQNFFKHADRDYKENIEFNPDETAMFLWDACQLYKRITKESVPLMTIYELWFYADNSDIVKEGFVEEKAREIVQRAVSMPGLDPERRGTFLELLSTFDDNLYKQS